ncbi:hypothetical protein [Budvicia aquatica]|uniref:hypothetical protein n=1 Tax=Budvicia aquatica TaxID=82979 RepID=UPI0020877B46|nr:hypothetical protein [Budvicia aquatica]GKX52219.1 hypothetical protein SOASR029_25280 [Budvicia aquatica]
MTSLEKKISLVIVFMAITMIISFITCAIYRDDSSFYLYALSVLPFTFIVWFTAISVSGQHNRKGIKING